MRAAPAVDAALGSGRVERMLITGLHAGTGAALALWAAARAEADLGFLFAGLPWLAAGTGALVLGAVGFALALQALPCAPARLCWDSTAWQLGRGGGSELRTEGWLPLQRVVVALDLGAWMLLQLVPGDGTPARWRTASARGVGTAWHGLRVALQAHAGDPNKSGDSAADPSAGQPGARP